MKCYTISVTAGNRQLGSNSWRPFGGGETMGKEVDFEDGVSTKGWGFESTTHCCHTLLELIPL